MSFDKKELTLKQNILFNSIGCLIYQGCQWAITIAAVVLSSDYSNSGSLAFAMATGNIFFPLATYNMRTIQVSDVNGECSQEEYVGFRIVTVLGAVPLICCYAIVTAPDYGVLLTTACWLLFKADESFCSVYYGVDQVYMRMDYIGISQLLRGVLLLTTFCLLLVVSGSLNIAITAAAAACVAITIAFDRLAAASLASVRPNIAFNKVSMLVKKYLPAVITLTSYGAVVSIARQTYGSSFGTEGLGVYAAVATPTVLIQVSASYLYSPMLGEIARLWNSGNTKAFVRRVLLVIGAIICFAGVGIMLSELIGDAVLKGVYGESIAGSTWLLSPALIATAMTTIFAFSFDILTVMRKIGSALIENLISLGACVAVSGLLINGFGANGVNITITLSYFIGLLFFAGVFIWSVRSGPELDSDCQSGGRV